MNSIFLKKCKNGLKNGVLPKKSSPFLAIFTYFLAKFVWPYFFWPILSDFFISPGNMFIWSIFLRMNSIFLKKCKNGLKNRVLPKKSSPFLAIFTYFLAKFVWPYFFLADFVRFFYFSRKHVYLKYLSTNELDF